MIKLLFLPGTILSDILFTEAGDLNRTYLKHSILYAFQFKKKKKITFDQRRHLKLFFSVISSILCSEARDIVFSWNPAQCNSFESRVANQTVSAEPILDWSFCRGNVFDLVGSDSNGLEASYIVNQPNMSVVIANYVWMMCFTSIMKPGCQEKVATQTRSWYSPRSTHSCMTNCILSVNVGFQWFCSVNLSEMNDKLLQMWLVQVVCLLL